MYSYVNVDTLKAELSLPASDTARNTRLLRSAEAASQMVDGWCGRTFRTYQAAKQIPVSYSDSLGYGFVKADLLQAIGSLATDDDGDGIYEQAWTTDDYTATLYQAPAQKDPYVLISAASGSLLSLVGAVNIVGIWSYWLRLESAGMLAAALASTTATTFQQASTALSAGDTVRIDSEQLYVRGVSGTTITVERGVNGTTAATHLDEAAVQRYRYPPQAEYGAMLQALHLFKSAESPTGVISPPGGGEPIRIPGVNAAAKQAVQSLVKGSGLVYA